MLLIGLLIMINSLFDSLPEYGIIGAFIIIVIALVWLFLKQLTEIHQLMISLINRHESSLRDMNERCFIVVEKNTEALNKIYQELVRLQNRN